ncbi:MAG TPA: DUF4328 domain-containing protein [Pyrinomonadaceae bacterium]|nr:DUF4328 domain-containing protein [Pyrinomonadaceae bacterium]
MQKSYSTDGYRPLSGLSTVLTIVFGVLIAVQALYILLGLVAVATPDWVIDLDDEAPIPVMYMFIGVVAMLEIVLRVATIVVFLIWEHRAYKNLYALRATYLAHSPGWAVGWWFIPFANLVKPYVVMKEIWRESEPEVDPDSGFLSSAVGVPGFFAIWWAAWIIGNIMARITERASENPDGTISDVFPVLLAISSLITGIAAILVVHIVRQITQRQETRYQNLGAPPVEAPPPPPDFGYRPQPAPGGYSDPAPSADHDAPESRDLRND